MTNNRFKYIVLITLIIILAIAIGGYFIFRPDHQTQYTSPANINTSEQPTIGNTNASIHIIAFEDLKCIACKIYNNSLYPKIKKKYIDTGIAKYTFINVAFIDGSTPAANAAHCLYAQNKKFFFPFVEYIYHNQPPETEDWATIGRLLQFAKAATAGANLDKLSRCIISGSYNAFLQKNLGMVSKLMKGSISTPAIYINGIKLNSLTMPTLDKLIQYVQKKSKSREK